VTYGTDLLMEEVSYVAYHFHWPFDQILDLEHPLRRDFVARIAGMNAAANAAAEERMGLTAGAGASAGVGAGASGSAGDGW
jgi:hypothetical protein